MGTLRSAVLAPIGPARLVRATAGRAPAFGTRENTPATRDTPGTPVGVRVRADRPPPGGAVRDGLVGGRTAYSALSAESAFSWP